MDWFKQSIQKIWDEILKNIGVVIFGFLISGGYLVAVRYLEKFRDWIRSYPSDWFLTPLVLFMVLAAILLRINHKQRKELTSFKAQTSKSNEGSRLVTHVGVWWKIYPDSRYIEDFPYCPCCEPPKKLVQTEWFEDEIYKCPHTNTEIKLYDHVPRKRDEILNSLYSTYFKDRGALFHEDFYKEFSRRKELNPEMSDDEIFEVLLKLKPLSFIPEEEIEEIRSQFKGPHQFMSYLRRHYDRYAKYIEPVDEKA